LLASAPRCTACIYAIAGVRARINPARYAPRERTAKIPALVQNAHVGPRIWNTRSIPHSANERLSKLLVFFAFNKIINAEIIDHFIIFRK
jgi:hypothetical protein